MRTIVRTNNNTTLIGRVSKVQEFGKNVADVTIAIDNGKDREGNDIASTFVTVKCFEPKVYGFLKTGMLVQVSAHLANNNYTDKDGIKHYDLDVVSDAIIALESKAVVDAREAEKIAKIEAEKAAKEPAKKARRSKKAAA